MVGDPQFNLGTSDGKLDHHRFRDAARSGVLDGVVACLDQGQFKVRPGFLSAAMLKEKPFSLVRHGLHLRKVVLQRHSHDAVR
jgi:hypothetical protein